jgi:AMMECR1 domain-containing protein
VGIHGITIEFVDPATSTRRSATFLPEVAAHEGWDRRVTLEHLVRKSGCGAGAGAILDRIKLTRYQSATCTLTYDEYRALKEPAVFRGREVAEAATLAEEEAITVPAG